MYKVEGYSTITKYKVEMWESKWNALVQVSSFIKNMNWQLSDMSKNEMFVFGEQTVLQRGRLRVVFYWYYLRESNKILVILRWSHKSHPPDDDATGNATV